jgi:E-phenylitaconyl-CoA hydratase
MINYQKEGPIGIVELDDQAALNALTPEGLVDLRNALAACQDDDSVRVIILTGAGNKAFCAGANLKKTFPPEHSFVKGALSSKGVDAENGGYTRLMDLSDLHIWKPVIAAINGYCLGGGLELAMQCDLRVASSRASFALPEVKVGSVPAVGGVQALIRAIPAAHAMKLALTGDRIDAETALSLGLVSDIYAPEALVDEALAIAKRIAANAPLAVQSVKKLALETSHLAPADCIAQSNATWGLLRDTTDRLEGRMAFAEKREPKFTGQ